MAKSHPFKHLRTILKHRHRVIKNASHFGIFWQAQFHDLSKFGFKEFSTSARYYTGTHSPVYEERIHNDFFSTICQHHTKKNKHHWEYYVDFFAGRLVIASMPWKYAMEYVADTLSASYTYNPKAFSGQVTLDYFNRYCPRYQMTKLTEEFIRWCLETYAESGFKGLKKKATKAKYEELAAIHPKIEIRESLTPAEALPAKQGRI